MDQKIVVDLSAVRAELNLPTGLAAHLAVAAGATILAIRPGCIEIVPTRSATESVRISVRAANVYAAEVAAYALAGQPIPPVVIQDLERWERRHQVCR